VVRESDRNSAPTPVTLTVPAPTTCKCRQIPIDSAEPGMLLRCPLLIRTTSDDKTARTNDGDRI
jgi:hypothetical protein